MSSAELIEATKGNEYGDIIALSLEIVHEHGRYTHVLDGGVKIGSISAMAEYLGENVDEAIESAKRWWDAILFVVDCQK